MANTRSLSIQLAVNQVMNVLSPQEDNRFLQKRRHRGLMLDMPEVGNDHG
jgi:hypothetical protein